MLPLGLQAPLGAGPPAALHLVLCPPPPAARPHPKSRHYPPGPLSPAIEGVRAQRARSSSLFCVEEPLWRPVSHQPCLLPPRLGTRGARLN